MQDWSCQLSGRPLGKQLALKFGPPNPLADLLFDEPEAAMICAEIERPERPGEFVNSHGVVITDRDIPF